MDKNTSYNIVGCHFPQIPPDSKVHGANMGPTWVLSAPGGSHVGPINLAVGAYFNGVLSNRPWRYDMDE